MLRHGVNLCSNSATKSVGGTLYLKKRRGHLHPQLFVRWKYLQKISDLPNLSAISCLPAVNSKRGGFVFLAVQQVAMSLYDARWRVFIAPPMFDI